MQLLRTLPHLAALLSFAPPAPAALQQGGQTPAAPAADAYLDGLLPHAPAEERLAAFAGAAASGDARYRAPLVDLLRHADTAEEWYRILDALGALWDEDLRALERPWRNLTLRLAADAELPAFEGYAAWKGELLAQLVDERFREFLHADVPTTVGLDEVVWGGVAVDGIPALDRAKTLSVLEAGAIGDQEPVFGVVLNGVARAYPLRVLDWHEMANDVVGGIPVALSYCTLCGAGVLYETRVAIAEGDTPRVLRFGSSGLLMRSNKLMYDDATRSLWNQLTGEPVVGSLVGSGLRLEVLPLVLTTWGAWRRAHPTTDVVDPETGFEREYRLGAAYGDYFASVETMFPAAREQQTLRDKERVYVVRDGSAAAAFPLEDLRSTGRMHGRVGESGVVVLAAGLRPERALGSAWSEVVPSAEERTTSSLTEAELQRAWQERPHLVDAELLLDLEPLLRARFLAWATAPDRTPQQLPARLRDEVAVRALAAPVRAYRSGGRRFASDPASGADANAPGALLMDDQGHRWRITEDALVPIPGAESPSGSWDQADADIPERLSRLPGHLAYGFGWDAFFKEAR